MALIGTPGNQLDKKGHVQLGNRNDICYLCQKEVVAKNDIEYNKKIVALRGQHEGKPMLKVGRAGTDINICMNHVHQIANENPLPEQE